MPITITVDDRMLKQLIADTGGPAKTAIVADGVEYGIHLEFGTSKMRAYPAARPAVEAVNKGLTQAFMNHLTDVQVGQVIKKGAFDIERGWKERARVDTGAYKNSIHTVIGDSFTTTFESEGS